ncbi:MAG: DUF1844 domain-containing protein [Planctomycetaceae bacterium]|nr:DUF1844 domain-containing protein [Planctomycetaceae bacterium]
MSDETPRLHIDSDWKAQAQAEKERLAEKEAARTAEAGPEGMGELPPADFRALVATLASQAMMGLGAYADPQSGRVVIDVVGAQFAIDLLGVIEEKTKGNLTEDEAAELKEVLAQLRARFVQIAKLVAAQMQREMAAGAGGVPGAGGGPGVVGSIGMGAPGPTGPAAGSTTKSGLIIPD